jgi:hypothetical protein
MKGRLLFYLFLIAFAGGNSAKVLIPNVFNLIAPNIS